MVREIIRVSRVWDVVTGAATSIEIFDLHLALDEVAEIVAVDFNLSTSLDQTDVAKGVGAGWVSLDPDDIIQDVARMSDDCLVLRWCYSWWKDVVGAQEAGQNQFANEFIHFPPGIFTAVNPIAGIFTSENEVDCSLYAALYYRVLRPTVNELAAIVARRR